MPPALRQPSSPTGRRGGLWALLVAATLGAGCASAVKYVEPASGDRARVRFTAEALEAAGNVFVRALPIDRCDIHQPFIASLAGRYGDHARRTAGMPGAERVAAELFTEVHVPAGDPFRFWVQWETASSAQTGLNTITTTTTRCGVVAEFVPQRDRLYEVTYRREAGSCRLTVSTLLQTAEGRVSALPERTAKRSTFQCR